MAKTLEEIKGMNLKVGDVIEIKGLNEHENLAPWEHAGYFVGCYRSYYKGHREIVMTSNKGKIPLLNETNIAILPDNESLPMSRYTHCIKLDYIDKITKMVEEKK